MSSMQAALAAGELDAPPLAPVAQPDPEPHGEPGRVREPAARPGRRLLAPEVVQTSSMDCGPAALKCLLEGHGIPVSYGRLREACQTDVDGTSIDTLELVANQLGIVAEQVLIPADHVFLAEAAALPAIVVVHHADGALHFVVAWRRHGAWLQVMDPAVGRRWVRCRQFADEIFRHQLGVPPRDWRAWAESADFLLPVRRRLADLGVGAEPAQALVAQALAYPGWFALAALDAGLRLVDSVARAGGIKRGVDAARLLGALFERTCASPHDIFKIIPPAYWAASPDGDAGAAGKAQLTSTGAVLLRVRGRALDDGVARARDAGDTLSPELAAALAEQPVHPVRTVWEMLKADGLLGPMALLAATVIAVGATAIEALLFRGMFELGGTLKLPGQRLMAVAALLGFAAIMLLFRFPVVSEALRFGRHLEVRLRVALLRKLPVLSDRYFHSRPVSDMADRSHAIHLMRQVPAMGLQLVQCLCELALTLVGIALIAPGSSLFALSVVAVGVAVPVALQPLLNERDLRVRNQGGALNGFYLDALLGLAPIRAHRAAQAVRRRHEALLVEWMRSSRSLVRLSMLADGAQSVAGLALAGALLIRHFLHVKGITGADLLLVYWTLKLPGLGNLLATLSFRYPAQRNVLMRQLEPLDAPEDAPDDAPEDVPGSAPAAAAPAEPPGAGVRIEIEGGQVRAGGHTILEQIDLRIGPGEHVAIVGMSGAGKSTLLGLLLGWHRLGDGHIAIDGQALGGAGQEALRRHSAWVDPAIQVWNRPLLENLRFSSRDDALERIGDAIDAAHLRQVLQKLPQGLQTWLGEAGALLSGGEGQRVRLARALVQPDVRLALLDEPFRGLDREQRSRLLGDVRRWWRGATMLCVTHDVGETLGFERVLVIEDGRIIEDGAPARLAQAASRYRQLLDAEASVRDELWNGDYWRRLTMQDGRLKPTGSGQ